jgi:xanthine dehydrogenase accessory factor
MDQTFFSKAQELIERNLPFAMAIVVRAEKPTSGKPGDKALITMSGEMIGWIGGSCSQPTVIRESLKAMKEGKSRFIRLSPDPQKLTPRDGLIDFPLTCFSGGTLEIYIEPQYPQPRLLVIGSLPVARALAELGKVMNYDVVVVDPDDDGNGEQGIAPVVNSLADIGHYVRPDTYAVVATHGSFDEPALEQVLNARPRYIGLVASHKRFQSVLEYLRQQGVGEADLGRIKAPAGLDIQAQQGDEIALSIMAEIVQYRRQSQEADDWTEPSVEESAEPATNVVTEPASGIAIDPVCQMDVDIATAKFTYDYEGKTYYFCAPSCKMAFRKHPQAYLNPAIALDPVCNMEIEIASAQFQSDYQGTTYYFCGDGCKAAFDQSPEAYAVVMHHH